MTQAQFHRGPYDGMILDAAGLQRYCHAYKARQKGHTRHFYLLPPLKAWDAVVSGWVDDEAEFKNLHIYELISDGESAELQYRTPGGLRDAMRLTA